MTQNGNGAAPAIVCPECGHLVEKAMTTIAALEAALVARQCTINALKVELEEKRTSHKHAAAARRLCDYWNLVVKNGRATKPDSKERFTATAARLSDGYSEGQLRQAIDALAVDPYVIDRKTHNDITTAMKSSKAVDDHMDRAPSEDEMLAWLWLRAAPSDLFWMDVELAQAREEAETDHFIRELDQLQREVMAGGGPLVDYYQARNDLRVGRGGGDDG